MTYVVYYDNKLVRYFTKAMSSLHYEKTHYEKSTRPDTDIHTYPSIIIPFLAIGRVYRKRGFGSYILKWCIGLGRHLSKRIGCRYITLYAREALAFYEKNGFVICEGQQKQDFKLLACHIFTNDQPVNQSTT